MLTSSTGKQLSNLTVKLRLQLEVTLRMCDFTTSQNKGLELKRVLDSSESLGVIHA